MNAFRIVVLSTLVLTLCLVGCKKDEPTKADSTTSLVATWIPQSATVDGNPTALSAVFQWVAGTTSARFTFNTGGTFRYAELNSSNTEIYNETGTYTVSGNALTITATAANGQPLNPPNTFSGTFAISGNTLTVTVTGSNTVVIVFTKA